MKRVLAILLCIVMMLSMVACGGNQDNNENQNATQNNNQNNNTGSGEITTAEPTAEDWEAIDKYRAIMKALNEYAEEGYITIEYSDLGIESDRETASDMDALALCYDQLTKLEVVDKWVGSEYVSEDYDRQKALDKFTIVKDVLLKREIVQMDHLGNETSTYFNEWAYNPDGTVHRAPLESFSDGTMLWATRMLTSQVETNPGQVRTTVSPFFVYNADGQVEKIEYKSDEDESIEAARIFTYEGNRIASEKIIYADGTEETVSYTYNSNGMLVEMVYTTGNPRHRFKWVYSYEYNAQGQVTKETVSQEKEDYHNEGTYEVYGTTILAYTYDSNGQLVSAVNTNKRISGNDFEVRTDNWTYTCNETGRLLSVNISCEKWLLEETGEESGIQTNIANVKLTFQYGDYYIYNSVN